MKLRSRFFLACLVVALTVLPGLSAPGQASPPGQENAARVKAQNLLQKMTPEERVGQLFLVTLTGNSFDATSQIYDLITQHHVGGVILLRANDNFGGAEGTLLQTYQLNKALQDTEQLAAQNLVRDPVSGVSYTPNYIPLFIGISQEGDLYPNDQIISGMTPLPDLMSIGATWDPSVAQQVGAVMGQELSTLGFNLYLGPSLDVLDTPQMDNGEDLGVRTFGGDPYWVGKMGEAYVAGIHQGSNNHMAVIAKNFPGRGSSDRSPEEEIATVRKSLEQLKQIELAPFFAVTGNAPASDMVTDGLLVSHIRYQGFQGNIRSTTRPVSSDATAMEQILQVTDSTGKQPFVTWRSNGGVMVSDNLGSEAVRKFYDPTGNGFDARTAAREAFFAGNDLLYVDRFIGTNDPDAYTTIVRTMEFFAQKYREDNAFAQRVDASVERILTLKYRLYPDFQATDVVPSQDGLLVLGKSQQVTFDVARRSVTLISPSAADLPTTLAQPPAARERVLFLTDVQVGRQCSGCQDDVSLTVDALQSTVLRLYGPRGSGQVSASLMASYPFSDLLRYLNGNSDMATMETDIRMSDWIVVSMLKPNSGQSETQAFRRLLNERFDLLRNKKIIVFAFNAPYYLDATDISKLTAYYGMYSKSPAFVDVAARVLFQELMPTGLLPVSVPGVGYDLIQATSPDPNQAIPLSIDQPVLMGATPTGTPEPTPQPNFKVNDVIPLRTGVIYDHNHNPVPDGTPVRFVFSIISTESGSTQTQMETVTVDGMARWSYRIERAGILEIYATTQQGARSNLIRFDTVSGGVTIVPPTLQPTETPTLTPTATETLAPTPTVTATPVPPSVGVSDWFLGLAMVLASGAGIAWLGIRQAIARWGLRWALCGAIGGMLAYNYFAFKLPGSQEILNDSGTRGIIGITLTGILLGWMVGLIWKRVSPPAPPQRSTGERPVTGPKSQSS